MKTQLYFPSASRSECTDGMYTLDPRVKKIGTRAEVDPKKTRVGKETVFVRQWNIEVVYYQAQLSLRWLREESTQRGQRLRSLGRSAAASVSSGSDKGSFLCSMANSTYLLSEIWLRITQVNSVGKSSWFVVVR